MLNMKVKISGDKELLQKLTKLGPQLTQFSSAMREVGDELVKFYGGQVFASQGGAIGKRWKPLLSKTKLYKAKTWPGRGPLIRTGHMQQSFKKSSTQNSVTITNDAEYFKYHQLGTGYGGGVSFGIGNGKGARIGRGRNLPARRMLGVNKNVRTIIQEIVEKDIRNKLSKAGL